MHVRSCSGIFFTVAAALALAASPARAQSVAVAGSWTVTPFIGTTMSVGGPLTDNSVGLGVAVGYDLTPNVGVEGEISHLFDVVGNDANVDWGVTNFSANAIYRFDVKNVTPYATFGLGVEHSGVSVASTDPAALVVYPLSSTEVAVNFGGGIEYKIRDRLLARADLRRFAANDLAPDYWRLYGGLTFVLSR